ncbi:GRAS family transcription factor [Wolffia australiana]
MAFLCSADSGNLMAIAQQVIQQQQKQQEQQQQPLSLSHHRDLSQIQMPGVSSFTDLFHFEPGGAAVLGFVAPPPPPTDDAFFRTLDCANSAVFDADEWMESLIGDSPDDLNRVFLSDSWEKPPNFLHAAAEEEEEEEEKEIPPQTTSPSAAPLLQSLLDCVRLLDSDPDLAARSLGLITASCSDSGDPAERVAFYFSRALLHGRVPSSDSSPEELILCYKALDDASPYIKFAHLTANQAILESTAAAARIHVVDFGIVEGVQWAPLLQALATRPAGKPAKVRISGVARPSSEPTLAATGDRLGSFAANLGLDFEFQPVHDLSAAGLRLCAGEAVAVNFTLQLHSQSFEAMDEALRLAKSLSPTVVTLGEYVVGQDGEDLTGVVSHYAAVFESLEPVMDRGSPERRLVEGRLLGPQLMAAVGPIETRPRMRGTAQRRALMEKAGFESVALSHYAVSQAGILLWNYNYSDSFSLVDSEPGYLSLAWRGQPLLSVSSWR